ncbi:hypothetical protein QBC43DRAFT_126317 [Cladorrhinum sp. PSN259]|nr:hypothetical protein QBC43DRAFT_126317 [Cladorrhinum sp. PSN259]
MSGTALSDPAERFSLVSSFYGPGNITSWLCTVTSVFVTWCLNTEHRHKDSISTDLIFALAVPSVAAGHALYLILISSDADGHETVQELFTSSDPRIVQHAAAAEAALNVCETFAAAAVLLVFISIVRGHLKRAFAVVIVGLLAFSTETVVFIQTRGSGVSASNLSRPFLFNFSEAMASILAFLGVWLFLFIMAILWFPNRTTADQPGDLHFNIELANAAERGFGVMLLGRERMVRQDLNVRENWRLRSLTFTSSFFLPFSFGVIMFTKTRTLGPTEFMSSVRFTARLPFFVPKSTSSITELDQMVTLCIGFTALIFNFWQAFKSQKMDSEGTTQERTRRQETRTVRLLLRLNDELDQVQNETERQALLDRRSVLLQSLSWIYR